MINSYLKEQKEYPLAAIKKRAEQLKAEGKDVIDLTIGDPQEPTFPQAIQSIKQFMDSHPVSQYPLATGSHQYLSAVSSWAKSNYGIELEPITHVFSSNGSKEAIFLFPLVFDWSDGKEIWISSVSYPVYEASARTFSAPVRKLKVTKETGFFPDLTTISSQEWEKCRLYWINSPHNPTSMTVDRGYFQDLLALAEKHDFIVCSDECYNELYERERPACSLDFGDSDRWIAFRSLSKRSHMTGFRVGAVMSKNTEIMAFFRLCRSPIGVGTPMFNQVAGITAWNDESHVQISRKQYAAKRQIIRQALEFKGFEIYGGKHGFYFWISHPQIQSSDGLFDLFLNKNICTIPGTVFGKDGQGYIRIVYCIPWLECQKLCDLIAELEI